MKQNVASFWFTPARGKGISKLEFLTIKSWLDNGYKFILYTYNLGNLKLKTLAENFKEFYLKDANEIVPFQNFFSDNRGGGIAAFSDYFRFRMIQQTGVPWVDMDMVCLNHSEILKQDYVFIKEKQLEGKEDITTALLKFPQNSTFGEKLIKESEQIIAHKKMVDWGVIGPNFLAKCVKEADLEHYALDAQSTCQVPWFQARRFVSFPSDVDTTQFCLHLYTDAWRQEGMYKDAVYHQQSAYSQLLARHDIDSLLVKCNHQINFYDKYIHTKISFIIAGLRKLKHRLSCYLRNRGC